LLIICVLFLILQRMIENNDFFKNLSFKDFKPKKGSLLISEPFLSDQYFGRSVIFISDYDNDGTLGFVINKATQNVVSDLIFDLPDCKFPVFVGGPVNPDNLYFLHTKGKYVDGSVEVSNGIYFGGDFNQIVTFINKNLILKHDIRFFIGYSGWSKGQLEEEIAKEAWAVFDGTTKEMVMKPSLGNKFWMNLLKSMGKYSVMANFPQNPGMN